MNEELKVICTLAKAAGDLLRKCTVYGATHSAATDWRKKYEACGLFNQPYNGAAVIDILKCSSKKVEDLQPIDGQMVMEADNG